jgi:hypothetical protein
MTHFLDGYLVSWKLIEAMFDRAFSFSFSKKKFFFLFPILVFCGIIIVFCRLIASWVGEWLRMSLVFLPIFLCTAFLLATGVILIRIYHNEVKKIPLSYRKTIQDSSTLMFWISHLAVPLFLAYLALWTLLGLFYLLKEIPHAGHWIGVFLSFGPFLLVLGSLVLSLFSIFLLFFVIPPVALKSLTDDKLLKHLFHRFRQSIFSHVVLFLLSLLPLLFVVVLMSLAAYVTDLNYLSATHPFTLSLEWFFIMVPFCAILTPLMTFFFNFSAESYISLTRYLDHS